MYLLLVVPEDRRSAAEGDRGNGEELKGADEILKRGGVRIIKLNVGVPLQEIL
jgi:hypothetical protein